MIYLLSIVGSVSSFGGNPMQLHIGIAGASTVDELHIRWPASPTQDTLYRSLRADTTYRIREGDPQPQPVVRRVFHLGDTLAPTNHHH